VSSTCWRSCSILATEALGEKQRAELVSAVLNPTAGVYILLKRPSQFLILLLEASFSDNDIMSYSYYCTRFPVVPTRCPLVTSRLWLELVSFTDLRIDK